MPNLGRRITERAIEDLIGAAGILDPVLRSVVLRGDDDEVERALDARFGASRVPLLDLRSKILVQPTTIGQADMDQALAALGGLSAPDEALFELVVLIAHSVGLKQVNQGLAALGEPMYAIPAGGTAAGQFRPPRWGRPPAAGHAMRLACAYRSSLPTNLVFRVQMKIVSLAYGGLPIPDVLLSMGHRIDFWGLSCMDTFQYWMCHGDSFWPRSQREYMAGHLSRLNLCEF